MRCSYQPSDRRRSPTISQRKGPYRTVCGLLIHGAKEGTRLWMENLLLTLPWPSPAALFSGLNYRPHVVSS